MDNQPALERLERHFLWELYHPLRSLPERLDDPPPSTPELMAFYGRTGDPLYLHLDLQALAKKKALHEYRVYCRDETLH